MTKVHGVLLGVLFVLSGSLSGKLAAAVPSEQFPPFAVAAGQVDADGLPLSGAKLCLKGDRNLCFQMPSHRLPESTSEVYQFGLEPKWKILPLAGGGAWVYFSATFSGGGSGTLTQLTILRYANGKIVNLLPYVAATNVSEQQLMTIPKASAHPILINADFIWGEGETHFDPHYYTVQAWKFDPASDRYARTFSYKTTKKYSGGDATPIKVIEPERQEILKRLAHER